MFHFQAGLLLDLVGRRSLISIVHRSNQFLLNSGFDDFTQDFTGLTVEEVVQAVLPGLGEGYYFGFEGHSVVGLVVVEVATAAGLIPTA